MAVLAAVRRALGLQGTFSLAWIALFTLLPDVIDKPVGLIWWELGSRRLFAHSLLFCLMAMLCCRLLWPRLAAYSWLLPVHLLLDQMWGSRHTLLFPFLGLRFDPDPLPPEGITSYVRLVLWKVTHQPEMLGGEILGLAVLGLYFVWGFRRPERAAERRRRAGPSPLQ